MFRRSILRVSDSARAWGVPVPVAQVVFWTALLGWLVLTASLPVYQSLGSEGRWLYEQGYDLVMGEDGPIEWLQFACLLGACLFATRIAVRSRGIESKGARTALWTLAILLALAVGEEVSWGQRIFGFQTPADLEAINDQRETTLHNLRGVRPFLNAALCLLGVAGFVFCGGLRRVGRGFTAARFAAVEQPPYFLAACFATAPLFWILRLTAATEPRFAAIRNGEWSELCLALGLCGLLGLFARRPGIEAAVGTRASGGAAIDPRDPTPGPSDVRESA